MTIEIQLTKGFVTIVDDEDADLAQFKWRSDMSITGRAYAVRTEICGDKRTHVPIHRVILERKLGSSIAEGFITDHVDRNPLNNCRANLRLATHDSNMQNSCMSRRNTSGFKGVSWHSTNERWQAVISKDKRKRHLGYFDNPLVAARVYDAAAIELHGEFASTNASNGRLG
jgi:hypothetical protein